MDAQADPIMPDCVEVDGAVFPVRFSGFDAPLDTVLPDGTPVRLRPWRFDAHLDSLRACLRPGPAALDLDTGAFARHVLADSGINGPAGDALLPLALWWAAGTGMEARQADALPPIRPWTMAERARTLAASVVEEADGRIAFDVAGYVAAMAAVSAGDGRQAAEDLGRLDSGCFPALLDMVTTANIVDPAAERATLAAPDGMGTLQAAETLRLCRSLGWTPTQVRGTAAAEIDRLLILLDLVEPAAGTAPTPSPAASPSGLASHPDAVVFRFEDVP